MGENSYVMRPPSRHKTPPRVQGLDLPINVSSPVQVQEMFDKTWSAGIRECANTGEAMAVSVGQRPISKQQKSRKNPAKGEFRGERPMSGIHKLYDVPVIVTIEEKNKRRVLSATKGRGSKLNFQSSLDQDFLRLFD